MVFDLVNNGGEVLLFGWEIVIETVIVYVCWNLLWVEPAKGSELVTYPEMIKLSKKIHDYRVRTR